MVREAISGDEARAFFRRVRVDHDVLRERLAALDEAFGIAKQDGPPETRERAQVQALELLDELENRLSEHFEREEQGEFVANALRLAPRLSRRAEGLFAEHIVLTRRLRQIGKFVRGKGSIGVAWHATHAHYRRFLEDLREHERFESEVIQEALLDDLGGGG